jgi:hypothetical protein
MARAAAHHAETKRSTATVDGSHSARLVKPTITVSGQYLEWTASRALVVDGERAVVREDQRYQRAGDHEADLPVPGGAGTGGRGTPPSGSDGRKPIAWPRKSRSSRPDDDAGRGRQSRHAEHSSARRLGEPPASQRPGRPPGLPRLRLGSAGRRPHHDGCFRSTSASTDATARPGLAPPMDERQARIGTRSAPCHCCKCGDTERRATAPGFVDEQHWGLVLMSLVRHESTRARRRNASQARKQTFGPAAD